MRSLLIFWGLPLGFFWSWYYLSMHDINFGTMFYSRLMHDTMFEIYGNILQVEPSAVPFIIAKVCVVDTLLLLGIVAFRRRKRIRAWWEERRAASQASALQEEPAEPRNAQILSSAP